MEKGAAETKRMSITEAKKNSSAETVDLFWQRIPYKSIIFPIRKSSCGILFLTGMMCLCCEKMWEEKDE